VHDCLEAAAIHRCGWIAAAFGFLRPGHSITLPILSGSMGPHLPPGGTIRVLGCPWSEAISGDVVVFREGFRLVAHRQLFRLSVGTHAVVYQKGDANSLGGFVVGKQVVGVVTEARDARGSLTYSRSPKRGQARLLARQQVLQVVGFPLKRMIGFLRRMNCGRARHGDH
jgi:hypothetical protein